MLIRIMYKNRKYDMVKDFFLQNLIDGGYIGRFRRADGWVEVGRDPVRRHPRSARPYTGPERRDPVVPRPLDTLLCIDGKKYRPRFSGCHISDRPCSL